MTFLESILKQTNEYRAGRIPQDALETLKKYFDVEKSLELTQKYKNVDVVTTLKTTVYRAVDNGGNLSDAYNFISAPNQYLGKVYGVVKVLGSGTYILLDAITQGKVRIIALNEVAAKPTNTPYVPPAPIPNGPTNNTTDNTIDPRKDASQSNMIMAAVAVLAMVLLFKK